MTATFNDFGLSGPLMRSITEMGFEEATPIQEQAVPIALGGRDIIGQAQTGTGKTAAFGIPLVERLSARPGEIQGIVITPTRELAVQVAEELNRIGQYKGIRALPIYGGQDISRQIRSLQKRPHIIVGTPGRLMDHMRRRTISIAGIKVAVLDEADEMLNMGFIEDIEEILQQAPTGRQTLLFSATMPKPVQVLAQRFMRDPLLINISHKELMVPSVEHSYIEAGESRKFDLLCRLLDIHPPDSAIVFGRTKRRVAELSEALVKRGYAAEGIHGDLPQSRRDSVMRQFRDGGVEILVATDVAARGLDIAGVTHIFNFDIPQDPESYVHRIGRTGRLGKKGQAITFVTPREIGHLKVIERNTGKRIARQPIPSMAEVVEGQQSLAVHKLMQVIEGEDTGRYKKVAEKLLEENDSVTVVSAALKMLTRELEAVDVRLTEEAPQLAKGEKRPDHRGYPRGGGKARKPQRRRDGH